MLPRALLPLVTPSNTPRAIVTGQIKRRSARTNPRSRLHTKMHERTATVHVRTRGTPHSKNARTNSQNLHVRTRRHLVSAGFCTNEPPRCTFEPGAGPPRPRSCPGTRRRSEPEHRRTRRWRRGKFWGHYARLTSVPDVPPSSGSVCPGAGGAQVSAPTPPLARSPRSL